MERELQALQRDLVRFDRATRFFWLTGLVIAVAAAVLWVGARQAQSQAATTAARQIVLLDQANHGRIVLSSDTNNRPGIGINDDAGKARIRFGFGTQAVSPLFYLADETGRPRLTSGFSVERGDPQLTLFDAVGTSRVYLGFGVQLRTPQVSLNDEHGKDRIHMGWTTTAAALVDVSDESGNIVWKSGAGTSGGSGGPGGTGPQRKTGAP